jgi:hypothetical protein
MFKKKVTLSKKSEFLLYNILAATHPNPEFREWLSDETKPVTIQESELLEYGFVEDNGEGLVPTKAGINYFKQSNGNQDIDSLIKRLENVIPKNPSFEHIARNLTDTALVRSFYTIIAEAARRGDPDKPAAYAYWLEKFKAWEESLKDAEPNGIWEKHGNK